MSHRAVNSLDGPPLDTVESPPIGRCHHVGGRALYGVIGQRPPQLKRNAAVLTEILIGFGLALVARGQQGAP